MTLMKVSELSGKALDWAVAKAAGWEPSTISRHWRTGKPYLCHDPMENDLPEWSPSTDWGQCGPLIQASDWLLPAKADPIRQHVGAYQSHSPGGLPYNGNTPLVAVCRAIVATKFGDSVDVPDAILDMA